MTVRDTAPQEHSDFYASPAVRHLVPPISAAEYGCLAGRQSAARKILEALGLSGHMPPPPPVHLDPTLSWHKQSGSRGTGRAAFKGNPHRGRGRR